MEVDHRRRVHRPEDGGPAVVRRAAPGGRGQGEGADQAGDADAGDHHAPELLQALPGAGRHDRHGPDGGGGVHEDLQAGGGDDPDEPAGHPRRTTRTGSTARSGRSGTRSSTRSRPTATPAGPCWSARRASRRARCSRACSPASTASQHEVLNAKQHEREAHIVAAGRPAARERARRDGRQRDDRHEHGRPRHGHQAGGRDVL